MQAHVIESNLTFDEDGMMMVPRSYLVREQQGEKQRTVRRPSKSTKSSTPLDAKRSSSPGKTTDPVKIPPQRKSKEPADQTKGIKTRKTSIAAQESPRQVTTRKSFSTVSVDALLAETAIPIRRKPRGGRKSQKLPAGDHVSDFSRLLSEDLTIKEEASLPGSFTGNPQFDLLFGAMGDNLEDAMFVGSEGTTPRGLSVRSLSSDSLGSVGFDEASPGTSYTGATTPSITESPGIPRSSSYRKTRVLSTSEDCAENHPLNRRRGRSLERDSESDMESPPSQGSPSPRPEPTKQRSTFRSNLTASLRALRSAASTVSNLATSNPANRPDDFLTRSIFIFNPELTDDRRPPPTSEVPSPALRRYLNPDLGIPDPHSSGLDFCSYSDLPATNHPSTYTDLPQSRPRFPASIQLQTYLPPATRSSSGSASSPPRFGFPAPIDKVNIKPAANIASLRTDAEEGSIQVSDEIAYNAKTSFHASPILSRQREPRENPDFLRVLVCEMQMRRRGKFRENTESRACVWLPPRREPGGSSDDARTTSMRWKPLNADEL